MNKDAGRACSKPISNMKLHEIGAEQAREAIGFEATGRWSLGPLHLKSGQHTQALALLLQSAPPALSQRAREKDTHPTQPKET